MAAIEAIAAAAALAPAAAATCARVGWMRGAVSNYHCRTVGDAVRCYAVRCGAEQCSGVAVLRLRFWLVGFDIRLAGW